MKNSKRILAVLATLMVLLGSASGLMAQNQTLGLPEEPHGYPAYVQDTNGLKLELCLNSTLCFFDAVEAGNAFSEAIGFGAEAFWLLAGANTNFNATVGGTVNLTLALEAAFGGAGAVQDGNQISFGRVRIRFLDITLPGQYRVTHPYGVNEFTITPEDLAANPARPLNYVKDVGGTNPGNPAAAFNGTLASDIMNPGNSIFALNATSFITSPGYDTNASLLVDGKRYISDGNPGPIVGSPYGTNFLRVERFQNGDWEEVAYTETFNLNGRVFDETRTVTPKTTYDNIPARKLVGHGPINRVDTFVPWSNATVTGAIVPAYPIGYPLWYEDASGLKLTITFPPMGLSDPVDPPQDFPLNTAGETFYWSAGASIDDYDADGSGNTASAEVALEGTFGGDESVTDGNQIVFGRLRIRIDTPVAGTYTVIHPYGNNTFEVAVGLEGDGINFTQDIGATNPFDPDSAHDGAVYSVIGPNFLTWTTFNPNPALNDPLLNNPLNATVPVQFVGDPAIPHAVTGGTNGNIFRVIGPDGSGIDAQTDLFSVTGQVFAAQNLGFLPSIYLLLD